MGFSRNFKGITLRGDSLVVEGINNTGDDIREADITELGVIIAIRPDLDEFVRGLAELPLTSGRWDITIPDVPAAFRHRGQGVLAIGFVTIVDPDKNTTSQLMWGGDADIG